MAARYEEQGSHHKGNVVVYIIICLASDSLTSRTMYYALDLNRCLDVQLCKLL